MIKDYLNKIICGNCVEVMKGIPDNTIDLTVTSPPYDCYSEDTEVLTYNGWKLIKDVQINEKVMALNPFTKEVYWEKVINKYEYDYKGKLINFKNKHNIDLCVTPNHKMYVEYRDESPTRERIPFVNKENLKSSYLKEAKDIKTCDLLRLNGYKWKGLRNEYFVIPSYDLIYNRQKIHYPELKIKMNYWCDFFGVWIAEGSVRGSKGGKKKIYEISIKQKEGENAEKIRSILNKLPFVFKEYKNKDMIQFSITNQQLWEYLKQFGNSHQKFIPKEILETSPEYLKSFMKSYLMGDGTRKKGGYFFRNFNCSRSVSKILNDNLLEISLKLGVISRICGEFCVYHNRKYSKLGCYKKYINYDGKVCCLEIEKNNIIFVRRNGKCLFSGNSLRSYGGYSFDFENTAKELYRVTKNGGVVVWVVGDAIVNASQTGTSFKQALFFKEIGFNLHQTMIYQKNMCPFPSEVRYYSVFEYMFVFSKGKPKTINLLKDRENKWDPKNYEKINIRKKDGSLESRDIDKKHSKYGVRFNIWKYNVGFNFSTKDEIAKQHPAIFPEQLAEDHIKSWSNEGDIVLDPFVGSGTTCKMARLNLRNFIGIEISPDYCKIAEKRLANIPERIEKFGMV